MNNPTTTLLLAAAIAAAANPLRCQNWTELNAGQTFTSSETPLGSGPLTRIDGTLLAGESADLFLVHVDDPATFSVTAFGGTNFDSQMWMFDLNGRGIAFRDDDPNALQSTLTGQFLAGPGNVLIGISRFDNDAVDASGMELWQDQPYDVERQPDGPGGGNPFAQWDSASNGTDPYTLHLTGASFAAEANPQHSQIAWAWCDVNSSTTVFIPDPLYQHTPTGEPILIERLSQGHFRIDLPVSMRDGGSPIVSAYGGARTVTVESFFHDTKLRFFVDVFSPSGQPMDGAFTFFYRVGGGGDDRSAYCNADLPTASSYTPLPSYSFNGNRASPTIVRFTTGLYRVRFPGLGTTVSGKAGHAHATPLASVAQRAVVDVWAPNGTDMDVFVRTFDGNGTAIDAQFLVNYTESAADVVPPSEGSAAYVWADEPSTVSYTPNPAYTDDNGTFAPSTGVAIDRLGVGFYFVYLPDQDPLFSSVVLNLFGQNDGFISVNSWGTQGNGALVAVNTTDTNGNPADRRFVLQYTTSHPAGTPARNSVLGGGCNGSTLRATSRPVLGSTWQLSIDNLPIGATLAFVVVGQSNPNLPLDLIGMPGCVLRADLAVLATPFGNPAYSLAVPNAPSLIGASVFAQGGAFQPALNAFGAGLSNAVRGDVGDV